MKMRSIMISSFHELDNGVTGEVPTDCLEDRVRRNDVSIADFTQELHAALHEGDFTMTSPGMVGLTDSGFRRYAAAFT